MRIAVVGAGIGGLTAALCLDAAGIGDVTVYERSDEVHEIGAGIQLSPNGTRILHGLGLGDALSAVTVRPATGDMRRWEDWSCCRQARSVTSSSPSTASPTTTCTAPTSIASSPPASHRAASNWAGAWSAWRPPATVSCCASLTGQAPPPMSSWERTDQLGGATGTAR